MSSNKSVKSKPATEKKSKNRFGLTSQQIIGEWGSLKNFAEKEGISFSSLRNVINTRGARSRPIEEALDRYSYLNLLKFENKLADIFIGAGIEDYFDNSQYSRIDIIDTLRSKITKPKIAIAILREMQSAGILSDYNKSDFSFTISENKSAK